MRAERNGRTTLKSMSGKHHSFNQGLIVSKFWVVAGNSFFTILRISYLPIGESMCSAKVLSFSSFPEIVILIAWLVIEGDSSDAWPV